MLMGHTEGLSSRASSRDHLLADSESHLGALDDADIKTPEEGLSEEVLYEASFDELASNNLKYDMIIWISISLLLVLAWGVGVIMLLYLPFRRYVLCKDISSRKFYVTPNEIVYKVLRPSFVPFWGIITIEKRIPLCLVIDIIIEQGCLQAVYGIHTFRVDSVSSGKAAPVDELRVQGIDDPGALRKVIITEAAKNIQLVGKGLKSFSFTGDLESLSRAGSLSEALAIFKSPSKSLKQQAIGSPRFAPVEHRVIVSGELVLNKIEEVNRSVKKIELLIDKCQGSHESG